MDMFPVSRHQNGTGNGKSKNFRENDFTKNTDIIEENAEEKKNDNNRDLNPNSNGTTKSSFKQKVKNDQQQKRPEKFVKSTEKFEEELIWMPPEIPQQPEVVEEEIVTTKKSKKQNKKKSKKQVVSNPEPEVNQQLTGSASAKSKISDLNVSPNTNKSGNKVKKQNGTQTQNGLCQSENNHKIEESSSLTTSLKFLSCIALVLGIVFALFWKTLQ